MLSGKLVMRQVNIYNLCVWYPNCSAQSSPQHWLFESWYVIQIIYIDFKMYNDNIVGIFLLFLFIFQFFFLCCFVFSSFNLKLIEKFLFARHILTSFSFFSFCFVVMTFCPFNFFTHWQMFLFKLIGEMVSNKGDVAHSRAKKYLF